MVEISIKTCELDVGKRGGGGNFVDNYWVVKLLDDVVRALDVATPDSCYNVRSHLIEALSKERKK